MSSTNTRVGIGAGPKPGGVYDTAIGAYSSNVMTGGSNTAVGINTLLKTTDASYNTAIGAASMCFNETGERNTAVGSNSLEFSTTGNDNTAIGTQSLFGDIGAGHNTALGSYSGLLQTDASSAYNTYIGYRSDIMNGVVGVTGSTALGAGSKITGSHQVVLGTVQEKIYMGGANVNGISIGRDNGVTGYIQFGDGSKQYTAGGGGGGSQWVTTGNDIYYNQGNVGIGTTGPKYSLDVSGTLCIESSSPLLFSNNSSNINIQTTPNFSTLQTFNRIVLSVGMSSTGQYMLGGDTGGNVYVSSNYGSTWTITTLGPGYIRSVEVSSTGQYMLAGSNLGRVYLSINNGSTWSTTTITTSQGISSIALSSTGQYMLVGDNSGTGNIYVSINYGSTWTTTTLGLGSVYIRSVAVNSTGQYMLLGDGAGKVYVSSNYGSTWTITTISSSFINSVALSSTGQYMLSGDNIDKVYVSTDYGSTWTTTTVGSTYINSVSVSSNTGQYMLAGDASGKVYVSSNYGSTWSTNKITIYNIYSVAVNSTGQYMVSGDSRGNVYLSINNGSTWQKILSQNLVSQSIASVSVSQLGQYMLVGGEYNISVINTPSYNTTGNSNISIGSNSLQFTNKNNNTALGYETGYNLGYNTNIDGSFNTFLGSNADTDGLNSYSYSSAVGAKSRITESHQVVLGTSSEIIYLAGTDVSGIQVGIDNANPNGPTGYIQFSDGSRQYSAGGGGGGIGPTGYTGPPGPAYTSWTPTPSSDISLITPTTVKKIGGTPPANVTSVQSFDTNAEGVYLQFTAPTFTEKSSEVQGIISVSSFTYTYYFDLTFPSNILSVIATGSTIYTGNFTPGDNLAIYVDGININFLQNGNLLISTPVALGPTNAQILMVTPSQDLTVTDLLFYPTGRIGPTGASPWQLNGMDTYYTQGNVGIGTSTPAYPLDVFGETRIANSYNSLIISTNADSAGAYDGSNNNIVIGDSPSIYTGIDTQGNTNNTLIGYNVGNYPQTSYSLNNSIGNVGIGNSVFIYGMTGSSYNIGIGYEAFYTYRMNGATGNIGIGINTFALGNDNIPDQYGNGSFTASNNVAIGCNSLINTNESFNTAIGYNTGTNLISNNTDGSSNTFLGAFADTDGMNPYSYSTAVGTNSRITASNQIVLGTSSETIYIPGNFTVNSSIEFINNTSEINISSKRLLNIIYGSLIGSTSITSVALNYSGNYMIAGDNAGNVYTGNANSNTFLQTSISNTNIVSISMSSSGKYTIAIDSTNAYINNGYNTPLSWQNTLKDIKSNFHSVGLSSATGQYMVITDITVGVIYVSNDSGVTWQANNAPGIESGLESVSVSSDGTYMVIANSVYTSISVSSDNGVTWNNVSINDYTYRTSISSSGQYMCLISLFGTGNVFVSNDYGQSFHINALNIKQGASINLTSVSMSSDGLYMVVGDGSIGQVYISNDNGVTWNTSVVGNSTGINNVSIDSLGDKIVVSDIMANIYVSYDTGNTWSIISSTTLSSQNIQSLSISSNGNYFIGGDISNGNIYVNNISSGSSPNILNSIYLGSEAKPDAPGIYVSSTAIGANSTVTDSHQIVLGTSNEVVYLAGTDTNGIQVGVEKNNGPTGYIQFSDGTRQYSAGGGGGGSQWITTVDNNIYYTQGNVGVGTDTPNYALAVNGFMQVTDTSNNLVIYSNIGDFPGDTNNVLIGNIQNSSNIMYNSNNTILLGNNNGPNTTNTSDTILIGNTNGSNTSNTSGNIAIGTQIYTSEVSGNYNIGIGNSVMDSYYLNNNRTITGSHNIGIGYQSLGQTSDGSGNVGIGYLSLSDISGNYNTGLGYNTNISSDYYTQYFNNSTAIGANATITSSNQVVLGTSNETVYLAGTDVSGIQVGIDYINGPTGYIQFSDGTKQYKAGGQWTTTGNDIYYDSGNVGIGTPTPLYPLDVSGTINTNSPLSLTDGTITNVVSNSTTPSVLPYITSTSISYTIPSAEISITNSSFNPAGSYYYVILTGANTYTLSSSSGTNTQIFFSAIGKGGAGGQGYYSGSLLSPHTYTNRGGGGGGEGGIAYGSTNVNNSSPLTITIASDGTVSITQGSILTVTCNIGSAGGNATINNEGSGGSGGTATKSGTGAGSVTTKSGNAGTIGTGNIVTVSQSSYTLQAAGGAGGTSNESITIGTSGLVIPYGNSLSTGQGTQGSGSTLTISANSSSAYPIPAASASNPYVVLYYQNNENITIDGTNGIQVNNDSLITVTSTPKPTLYGYLACQIGGVTKYIPLYS